ETALRRSVKLRTTGVTPPPLDDAARIANGFKLFQTHCVQCHGAPGAAPEPFALGLRPEPASLVGAAYEWPAADIRWIIQEGIKMSGMPAWKYRLTDEEIWDVVAFMKVLPRLTPQDYRDWSVRHPPTTTGRPDTGDTALPEDAVRLGDAGAGKMAIQQYLCATCHVIPGVVGANRHVGPALTGMASRQYIAGVLPNTPANMLRWLRDPTSIDPLTAMPDLGITDRDARDIAAFLYTLTEHD
ncbi:MAG TPA: c-type cytochrome, partial [Burkholderiaceae bacterium]|nr:c-type cytochrome [Burkholderiaceae bacterium]